MKRFFDRNNLIYTFMGRVSELLVLNALWLLCSLPIVTLGASTSALYYCMLKILRNEETYVWRMFLHSFRENLRQGILLTLIYLGLGALLTVDFLLCAQMGTVFGSLLLGVLLIFALLLLMCAFYTFPCLGQFENSIRGTLKTAFALAVSHPGQTLCIMALNLLPVGILLVSYRAFLMSRSVYLLLGFAVTAWLIAHFFVKMFAAFLPPAEVE